MYDGNWNTNNIWGGIANGWIISYYPDNPLRGSIFEEAMWWNLSYPLNPYLDVGNDGTQEWNFTGEFNHTNNQTSDFNSSLNTYLTTCTADSNGDCTIPLLLYSSTAGIIQISDIRINYKINFNPIYLNVTQLNNYLNVSTYGYQNIPIKIEANQGNVTVNGLNISYNGSGYFNITANSGSSTSILYLRIYYSRFTNALPYTWTNYILFYPETNSSQNVTPYGQTTSKPIFNITWKNYGNNSNVSIRINQTISCLNFTASNSSEFWKWNITLNTSYQTIYTNRSLNSQNTTNIWLWINMTNCNGTAQAYSRRLFDLKSCCIGCEPCW